MSSCTHAQLLNYLSLSLTVVTTLPPSSHSGYTQIGELGVWPYATYSGVLGVIVLVGVVLEVLRWREAGREEAKGQYLSSNPLSAAEDGSASRYGAGAEPSDSSESTFKRAL